MPITTSWGSSWGTSWGSSWGATIGDVTTSVAPTLLALVCTTAIVTAGTIVAVTPAILTLDAPTAVVKLSIVVDTTSTDIALVAVPTDTNGGTVVPASVSQLTIINIPADTSTGARVEPTPQTIALSSGAQQTLTSSLITTLPVPVSVSIPAVDTTGSAIINSASLELYTTALSTTIYGNAVASISTQDIQLLPLSASVATGAIASVDVVQLVIDVVQPRTYDKNGSITYTEAMTMKANIPEIIAFSTDITTDMLVVEAMEDDMAYMDGTQPVKLLRKTDNVVIDFTLGTAIPENKIYTFEHALIRQVAERDNRAVKQLRLFMQSVQNDEITTLDTIIELPKRDNVEIKSGDMIQSDLQGTKYTVIAIDDCTLKTRWRIGARKIV
jgi:hypothetical protein